MRVPRHYPLEPAVGIGAYTFRDTRWKDLDARASSLIGRSALTIPSIRVGLCWALEFLGCNRHRDHVLVPKFMGRCILNSLNRFALPIETRTPRARMAIAVHQFGFRQDLERISRECQTHGLRYVEDSPYGFEPVEELGPHSWAKFIGLSKVLPAVKGAIMITEDPELRAFCERRRKEFSLWSWPVFLTMAALRARRRTTAYAVLADAAYELYLAARGDNLLVRANIAYALDLFEAFASAAQARAVLTTARLGAFVRSPDATRLPYAMPVFPGDRVSAVVNLFLDQGFNSTLYHIDAARNLFAPRFERALLIPLHNSIPDKAFFGLVHALAKIGQPSHEPVRQPGEVRVGS